MGDSDVRLLNFLILNAITAAVAACNDNHNLVFLGTHCNNVCFYICKIALYYTHTAYYNIYCVILGHVKTLRHELWCGIVV